MANSNVPTILKYLNNDNDNNSYMVNQNIEGPPQKAKKRRLDHLSWEEKIQRKKLKNRVAAQTSRDRKKAKSEQMENAIQELFNKNEALLAECEKLKTANERLQLENAELHQRLQQDPSCAACQQNRTVVCEAESGSAESLLRPRGTATHPAAVLPDSGHMMTTSKQALLSGVGMPSLPDLLDELESDVDINALEQLTQSLLEDIAKDLESAARTAADQESAADRKNIPREVVGQAPKQLEPTCQPEMLEDSKPEPDVSEFLLHHNYAAKPQWQYRQPCKKSPKSTKKLKTIRPKLSTTGKLAPAVLTAPVAQVETENNEILYGTFDEKTNTITIMLNEDGTPIKEIEPLTNVTDISSLNLVNNTLEIPEISSNTLVVPKVDLGNLSPRSSIVSDLGYESLDSPLSSSEMDEWDRSVSELFPSLI